MGSVNFLFLLFVLLFFTLVLIIVLLFHMLYFFHFINSILITASFLLLFTSSPLGPSVSLTEAPNTWGAPVCHSQLHLCGDLTCLTVGGSLHPHAGGLVLATYAVLHAVTQPRPRDAWPRARLTPSRRAHPAWEGRVVFRSCIAVSLVILLQVSCLKGT